MNGFDPRASEAKLVSFRRMGAWCWGEKLGVRSSIRTAAINSQRLLALVWLLVWLVVCPVVWLLVWLSVPVSVAVNVAVGVAVSMPGYVSRSLARSLC